MSNDQRGRPLPPRAPVPPPRAPVPVREVESRTAIYVGSIQAKPAQPAPEEQDDNEATAIASRHEVLGHLTTSVPDAPLPEKTTIMQNTDIASAMGWNPMPPAPAPEPAPAPPRQPRGRMGSVQWPVPNAAPEAQPQYPEQPRARTPSYYDANQPPAYAPPEQPRARTPSYYDANQPPAYAPPEQPRARTPSYVETNQPPPVPSYAEGTQPLPSAPPTPPAPSPPIAAEELAKPLQTPPAEIVPTKRNETSGEFPRIVVGYLIVCAVLAALGLLLLGLLKVNDYF